MALTRRETDVVGQNYQMTPNEIECENQEQQEAADQARKEWHIQGITDATFGNRPQYANSAYLSGYCEGLQRLPINSDGTINWVAQASKPSPVPMYEYGPGVELLRGIGPYHDCDWLYPDREDEEF